MKELTVLPQACCSPGAPPLEADVARTLAARFKALSDPSRVAIVNRLAGAEDVCVCDFISTLGLSQPTISHHLRVLREAGIVEVARKRGTWVHYRLIPDAVEELSLALGPRPASVEAA
jgi:ArsR family transcriptional regulator, arsenate/arsenite/antimonite-responsive transcriptional repressor